MRLIYNAAFLWIVRVGTMASSALVSILTARALGPHGRGLYALPALDASLALTFAVGLSSALSYFLLKGRIGRGIGVAALAGLGIFCVAGAGATVATAWATHSLWACVPAILMTVFYAMNTVACGYFIGCDRVRAAGALNGAAYLLTLVFVGFALVALRASAYGAVAAWVAAWAIAGSLGLVAALRDARSRPGPPADVPAFLRFAAKAGALNVANLLNYRVDLYVVAILLPVATLGLYTIAVTGAEAALSLTVALAQSTLPRIGGAPRAEAAAFAARCLRNGLFLAAAFSLAGYVFAPPIVALVLGPAYLPLVGPFRVLVVGVVAASTTAVLGSYFVTNRGRPLVPLATSLLSATACAGLSFALVPRFGMTGAAIASTVAYVGSQTIALVLFCRESGIAPARVLFIDATDVATYRRLLRRTLRVAKAPT